MLEHPTRGIKRPAHLNFIRLMPCAICAHVPSEAAHVRFNRLEVGRLQALGQKPDDKFTVPLCAYHHREGPAAQHRIGEEIFWRGHGIDPHKLAALLFECSGDIARGESIARQSRRLACW